LNHRQTPLPLTEDLSRLPRIRASEGFTARVLTAVESRDRGGSASHARLVWVGATALMLVLLAGSGFMYQRQRAADLAYQHQLEELRSRYEQLLDEVVAIRQEAATPDTRLYLGGDESLDLMLDLNQLSTYSQNGRQEVGEVRPASWEQ